MQVVLSVSGDVVVEADGEVRSPLEDAQHHGVAQECPVVRLKADKDVGVRNARQRPDMLSDVAGTRETYV